MGKRSRTEKTEPTPVATEPATKDRKRLIPKKWTPVLVIVLLAAIGIESWFVYRWYQVQNLVSKAHEQIDRMDFLAAEETLAQASAIKPNDPRLILEFASLYRQAGKTREFESWIGSAEEAGANSDDIARQVLLMKAQGGFVKQDSEEFAQLLAIGEGSDRDAPQVYYALAKGFLASYQVREAEEAINSWLVWQPESVPARFLRGNIRYRYGQLEQAIADYRFVLEKAPDHAEANFLLGLLLNESGHIEEARDQFQKAVDLDGDSEEFKLELAFCVKQLGEDDLAKKLAQEILESDDAPRRAKSMELLAKLAIEAGNYAEARGLLEEAFRTAPANAELCHMMGTVLSMVDEPELAKRFMDEAQGFRDRHERIQDLTKQLIDEPDRDDLRLEVAELMFRDGLDESASMWLLTILKRNPNHVQSHMLLAAYYQRTGRPELAGYHRSQAESLNQASGGASTPTTPESPSQGG